MPSTSGSVAVEEPPQPPETPFDAEPPAEEEETAPHYESHGPGIHFPSPEPAPKPAEATPPRQVNTKKKDFFDLVRSFPKEDWGTRIFLYLYCFEPICDEKLSGEKKYLNRFAEPVLDEQAIMIDYGSGKYRLTLTNRKPAGIEKGSPIETYDFEIYNPKYPPRLPRAVWKNDPRNARWEALLPKEQPAAAANPQLNVLETFGTLMDIQDRVADRMTASTPPPPQPPTAASDPFDLANKIMNMRANDPMIAALMQRLEASDRSQEAARQREFELQKELRQAAAPPATPPKTLVDQIVELATVADKLGPLKALFGGSNGSNGAAAPDADRIVRNPRMGGLEFLSTVLPKILVESPLANALATKLMQPSQQPAAAMNGNGHAPAVQQPAADPFQRFINDIATPAMLEYFTAESTGDALADWIYSVFPRECLRLQKFTHPMIPGLVGAPAIIQGYKNTPEVWTKIAAKEAEFTEFINQFCNWTPEPDEDDGTIDATASPVDEDGWSAPSGPDREEAQA
jgi:hypothetical protein